VRILPFVTFPPVYKIVTCTFSGLEKVARDLKEIKDQSRWLAFFFKNLNKAKVDDCIARLQETLEKFQVCKHMPGH
jgi:hypothetical protein